MFSTSYANFLPFLFNIVFLNLFKFLLVKNLLLGKGLIY